MAMRLCRTAGPKLRPITTNIRTISTTAPVRSSGGSHSGLWTAERALSVGLIGVIPAALAFPSQGLDALMAVSIVMHQHWGLDAVVVDYVRPAVVGNVLPKVARGGLFLLSAATLGGLLYFSYNDVGLSKSIRKLWAIKGQ
ncbi:unnamed protein product [Hermetia illucens]|uniref:Succinate dehydrogenase [ubiquinone] cytochrome b small subunit n=2 Tax=Hermetia illucens TaxID=343691 RepID=A0A7R8UNU5_HERIL|nr:unnamed protein product [Hermetia illucens]